MDHRIIFLLIFICCSGKAEVFRWPKLCAEQTLTIENKSAKEQAFWLQEWDRMIINETDYAIPASSKIEISLSNDPSNTLQDYSLLMLDGKSSDFVFNTYCSPKNSIPVDSFEGGVVYYKISSHSTSEIQLKNLFPGRNTFFVEEVNLLKRTAPLEIDVESRELFTFAFKPSSPSTWVKIWATERFHSAIYTSSNVLKPSYIDIQRSIASSDEKYFLMGPQYGQGDQFVVKIKDPAMVQTAREQITNPRLQKIVFAKIALGHQGFNRNFIKKEKSFWSWSVTEVTNISDFGSTACNGFPQLVEDQAESWVNGPGKICFWSYRIKKELTLEDVQSPSSN